MPSGSSQMDLWITCQIGAREHYAVPRALHRQGVLQELITDLWALPRVLPLGKLRDRFHPELASARVRSANLSFMRLEALARASGIKDWDLIRRRNRAFQEFAIAEIDRLNGSAREPRVFTYSYAAKDVLRKVKERSWPTVLGQIDAGPAEEKLVCRLHESRNDLAHWKPAPDGYWDDWREETELADHIMVNSEWTKRALTTEGIDPKKITVIPLAFERPAESKAFVRTYPEKFTIERPLRVLFLGQINLRKGIGPLFEAINLLKAEPIEFWFVGPVQIVVQDEVITNSRVKFFGAASRNAVDRYYREADVFVFPTLSDGFGLTQLEAQAWRLPVIASTFCGDVVRHGFNGFVLSDVNASEIADSLNRLVNDPTLLNTLSANCDVDERFEIQSLASSITGLI